MKTVLLRTVKLSEALCLLTTSQVKAGFRARVLLVTFLAAKKSYSVKPPTRGGYRNCLKNMLYAQNLAFFGIKLFLADYTLVIKLG